MNDVKNNKIMESTSYNRRKVYVANAVQTDKRQISHFRREQLVAVGKERKNKKPKQMRKKIILSRAAEESLAGAEHSFDSATSAGI